MKQQLFFSLSLFLTLVISCTKERSISTPNPTALTKTIDTRLASSTALDLLFSGTLDHAQRITQQQGNNLRVLTPLKKTGHDKLYRYKITEMNNSGVIVKKGYIVSLTEIAAQDSLFTIPIVGESISYYSVKNQSSRTDKEKKTAKIIPRSKGKTFSLNNQVREIVNTLIPCTQQDQFCIDWYWIWFDQTTGQVVEEFFLYTICYDLCTGNYNGAGGTVPEINCEALAGNLQGGPVSISQGFGNISENQSTRTKLYSWIFYKQTQNLWFFVSHETGVHKKSPNGVWKWLSLTHTSISRNGFVIGGVINCILNSAIPEVGIFHAGMKLAYTIDASAICTGSPISFASSHLSQSPIWHVDYNPE